MCGIVGVLSMAPINADHVLRMRDSLLHRGPDHGECWTGDNGRIVLAHRRLAIIDLRPSANQPFISHDGRYALVFNGEIYNYRALRHELRRQHGAQFRTESDTEVLVEAFRAWGSSAPERINGMFAFAIWDTQEKMLFCSRDRAGEKPFYYCTLNGVFLFASELKALTMWPGFQKHIDYPALIDYLSFGYVTDPQTIWKGCRKLPAAHSMWIRIDGLNHDPTPKPYWDLQFNPDYSVRDWGPQIRETLGGAVSEMAISDVPLGAFLSGGVDSSSITAAFTRSGRPLKTFTIGFEEQAYDERPWARTVADLCGTTHHERVLCADDIGSVFERILWHYDEPFNDFSCLPTYYLCRASRSAVTVALSGDGGDELFAGYSKYKRLSMREQMNRRLPKWAAPAMRSATKLLPQNSRAARAARAHTTDSLPLLTDMMTTCFSAGELRASARGQLAEELKHYSPEENIRELLRRAPPGEVGLVNAMRYLDLKITLGAGMLVKTDRASMAVSLEVRPVYLHRSLLDLAGRIPPEQLCDFRSAKKALKKALEPWLPHSILYRPKMGFALPLKIWLPRGISGFHDIRESFADSILDTARLNEQSVAGDPTLRTHNILYLRHWLKAWSGPLPATL